MSGSEPGASLGAWAWLALMAGGWIAFLALAAVSEPTLSDLHAFGRDLPLLLELLVWLALFPFVLALTIWTGPWEEWQRLGLVVLCAVAWTLAFVPWRAVRRPRQRRHGGELPA